MVTLFNVAVGHFNSSTLLLDQETNLGSNTADLKPYPFRSSSQNLSDLVNTSFWQETMGGMGRQTGINDPSIVYCTGGLLRGDLRSKQTALSASHARMLNQRPLSSDETDRIRAVGNVFLALRGSGENDLADWVACLVAEEGFEEEGMIVTHSRDRGSVGGRFGRCSMVLPDSHAGTVIPRLLPLNEMNHVRAIVDVCEILRVWGQDDLAARIAYFASDEDLEEGDIPVTDESARGFLFFFGLVKSEGRVSLTCSPEGWLCAVWRFSDDRRASLWFLGADQVMFSATDANGDFIEIEGGGEVGNSREVMAKLVEAGLLTCRLDMLTSGSFHLMTTLPDTVVSGIPTKMESQWMERFYLEKINMNAISPQTGWNTSIPQTGLSRSTVLSSL